jgi:hypothetical protein
MTHTQSVDDVCDKTGLTRFVYQQGWISFTKSIVDRKPRTMRYSGATSYIIPFTDEVFEIVAYTPHTKDNHPMFEGYIQQVTQKMAESRGSHELIGGLIVNLAFCKDVAPQRNRQTAEH